MTDSMNFGPDWIRNLSSEGSTAGGAGGGARYQLADYRYGREEMLALFDRNIKPPTGLVHFKRLYSETTLPPLALLPTTDEERVGWQSRTTSLTGPARGRGTSLERGGRVTRGRGGFPTFGRPSNFDGGWGNGEQSDWSPRKEYNPRPTSVDNWRRARTSEEDDGWKRTGSNRSVPEKWGRQTSWRGEGEEERFGPSERGGRWHDQGRGPSLRRSWDNEEHLPEWAMDIPLESGGSFDDRGAFHGSDDEQEGKNSSKTDGLQKSTSQQHISHKTTPPLLTSKSTMSLVRNESEFTKEDTSPIDDDPSPQRKTSVPELAEKLPKVTRDRAKSEGPPKMNDQSHAEVKLESKPVVVREDNDFDKFQEDFVSKLVIDEDPPKSIAVQTQGGGFDMAGLTSPPTPPTATVPGQDKWFYLDPQGQMQGAFTNAEMTEWYKAGYFGQDLKVRRQCDERFYLLGELITFNPSNPFISTAGFPVLKNDISKMPEFDRQYQYSPQVQAYKQAQARILANPWSPVDVQQQELAAQRLIMQQQQAQQDLSNLVQHPPNNNPVLHMLSQIQQAKLPPATSIDKPTPPALDPHLHMHMTNFLSMQNRVLPTGVPNLPTMTGGPLPPDSISGLSGHPGANLGGIPIQPGVTNNLGINAPTVEQVEDNDPFAKLLKQLQQEKQQHQSLVENFWQQNQFGAPPSVPPSHQWGAPPGTQPEIPHMWDIHHPPPAAVENSADVLCQPQDEMHDKLKKTKESSKKEDEKEIKKKKKSEEEQKKREADEKRKQEQRKMEADKKAESERKKKEEERLKKEFEKARKEAEEKRLRELEEKRKLKEQRKLEEEARKRSEEDRKRLDEERLHREREQREREERQRAEERRQEQLSQAKAAPWSQASSTFGMSLAEIQKAEKEKKVQEAALAAQKAQFYKELQQQQQQQMIEKQGSMQMGWAKKAIEPRKVKSLAEIQAEEQERLAKEAAEARLKKEKEAKEIPQLPVSNSIWSGQNLTWANATSSQSQWSSGNNIAGSGFWEEPIQQKLHLKPSNSVAKSNSMSTISASKPQHQSVAKSQQQKQPKPKKDEVSVAPPAKNHNNNVDNEFTNWCHNALSNINAEIDVPTFVSFLRDIESAFEVRDYCKAYLGESNATQTFANNFLEKRRTFKQKTTHKDDMCSPAPAINPSQHNNNEFQEVKGKNKKSKKSKMLKVDSRILGFHVTSAPDRINVGDRDYGDNS